MASSEAVVIPVDVDFNASSVDALKGKLREAEALVRGLKDGGRVPTVLEIDTKNAKAHVKDLTSEIKGLEKASKDANAAAVKAYQFQQKAAADKDRAGADSVKAMFGTSVFDVAAGKLAGAFGKGKEETEAIKGALLDAGSGFAKVIGGAALAISAAGAGLIVAGLKLGIEGTAQKQKNIAVLDRLTNGQGELAETVSKGLAADTGVDEDKAMARVKELIQAKFDREDTEIVFKASADIGAGLDEGKADAFLSILEKVQHEGTATEKALKGLSGVGLDRSAVIEGLRQTGESAEEATARLKAGKVSASEFAKAASAAAAKDFGGLAGKDLDATFNRAKIAAGDLFDGMDDGLASVKDLGALITNALSGAEGAALKEQITAAGNSVLALTKNITAADIKGAFRTAGDAATAAAAAIKTAAGFAADLWNTIKQVSGKGSHMEDVQGGGSSGDAEEAESFMRNKAFNDKIAAQNEAKAKAAATTEEPVKDASAGALAGGVATGKAYADGLAQGIEANAGKPAAAAAAAMAGTIDAGAAKAQIKSPSKVTEEQGKNLEEGKALGIERNAGKGEAAASAAMGRTTRASAGASAGTGGASASGGGDININIVQNLPPGSNEATKEAARAGLALMLPDLMAALRSVNRLGGVGGGARLP